MSGGARAVVVFPDIRRAGQVVDVQDRLQEACSLAQAIGMEVTSNFALFVREVKPATLFGEGQVERIFAACEADDAELVVVDGTLSAIQQRNLEERLSRKVIDRTGLILEIFGERAATAEGRLQVELAHLDYQQSRLVRSWTHLERQRGGYGFLGGPGETQIEADRRMIRTRIARLRRELEQVRRTRSLHRKRRDRAPWPVIALVGYTNAGKSTLFNAMTGSDVMAQDMLFATLDPTMRAIQLPGVGKVILSDTVGFISDLPTQLVAAFRATLEEVTAADIIVHVRDIASSASSVQKTQVLEVLRELGVIDSTDNAGQIPMVEAWNKWDLLDDDKQQQLAIAAAKNPDIIPISALDGHGIAHLGARLGEILTSDAQLHHLTIPLRDGGRIAWLHAHGEVLAEKQVEDPETGMLALQMEVRLTPLASGRFAKL